MFNEILYPLEHIGTHWIILSFTCSPIDILSRFCFFFHFYVVSLSLEPKQ